jgi:hypothetical protein
VSDKRIEECLSSGYSRQSIEVVFAVSVKTLSNYVNHMAETPVNNQFMRQFWGQQFQSVWATGQTIPRRVAGRSSLRAQ